MEKKNSNPTNLHILKKEIGVFKVTISSELIDYFKYIQVTNFIFFVSFVVSVGDSVICYCIYSNLC